MPPAHAPTTADSTPPTTLKFLRMKTLDPRAKRATSDSPMETRSAAALGMANA